MAIISQKSSDAQFLFPAEKAHRKESTKDGVTPVMTQIGSRKLSALMPKNVFFIIVSPCVNGKTRTIFCITGGMTSIGNVVPEKTSMGK